MTTTNHSTQSSRTGDGNLPPLPKPCTLSRGDEDGQIQLGYTADQMRAYARAALAAAPAKVALAEPTDEMALALVFDDPDTAKGLLPVQRAAAIERGRERFAAMLAAAPAAPLSAPAAFPASIWSLLLEVADRNGKDGFGPWQHGDGEPMQDDGEAAIAWIKARAAAPAAPADAEALFERLQDAASQALTDANNAGKVANRPGIHIQSIKSAGELGDAIVAVKQAYRALLAAAPAVSAPAEFELPDHAVEINRLRNVIQAACSGGLDHMIERWKVLFPDAPVPSVRIAEAGAPAEWRQAVQEAYGWLWHINNEPLAPVPLLSEGKAAYQARKALRELLTWAERGEAINAVTVAIDNMAGIQAPATADGSQP